MDKSLAALDLWDVGSEERIEASIEAIEELACAARAARSGNFGHERGRWIRLIGLASAALGDLIFCSIEASEDPKHDAHSARLRAALSEVAAHAHAHVFAGTRRR